MSLQVTDDSKLGIKDPSGKQLDLEAVFMSDSGELRKLKSLLSSQKPTIFTLSYYGCPNLCGMLLNGLVDALKEVDWTLGDNFNAINISFDPREKSDLASEKKRNYLKIYGRDVPRNSWLFLTGDQENIDKATEALGFYYRWDEKMQDFIHAAGIFIVNPEGKVIRYLYGSTFESRNLRLALIESSLASERSFKESFFLFFFEFDSLAKNYQLSLFRVIAITALFAFLAFLLFLMVYNKLMRSRA